MSTGAARQRILGDLKGLQKEKWVRIDADDQNVFHWRLALMVINPDSDFNGGFFKAEMTFPADYPFSPPKFRFLRPIWHPNIYPDGQLCISILHNPGEDVMSGEDAGERWSPLQGAESVLRSVLLLLDEPEINSPANVDASVMYRDRRVEYNQRARDAVEASKKDIPDDFVVPTSFESEAPPKNNDWDDDFYAPSDEEEFDFDEGSDSDEAMDDAEDDAEGTDSDLP